MKSLATERRDDLKRAVEKAREQAEIGAAKALEALAVQRAEPFASMDDAAKQLRNQLRAHGRQLGDRRDPSTREQSTQRLVREVAYEHWHRMLFARYLAENQLLLEPGSGVAITLAECEELAREQGVDPWALAATFAQRMLPRIFRSDDPALAVTLPPETRQALEKLLSGLPVEVFTADDSLGWTYQFWQAREKDAVNARVKSGEKVTGETLPAVTQLFTENYMVSFLLHNTLGAWHAGRVLDREPELAAQATSEAELRERVRLDAAGGYAFDYLRFARPDDASVWRPAAGVFPGWPKVAAELKVLDPCCGSGHFLVAAFELLVRLRMDEEALSLEDAIRAVISGNLFGLELDPRCTQIAAFNVALTAWRLAGRPLDLPPLSIACSGLGPQATQDEWIALASSANKEWDALGEDGQARVTNGLIALHETFSKAPELGSLIDPTAGRGDMFRADFPTLRPFLDAVYSAEAKDDDGRERAVAARGMAEAAQILSGPDGQGGGYTLVITNVPYKKRGELGETIGEFVDTQYPDSRSNLATVFLDRILHWLRGSGLSGTVAVVTPQNWLFASSYRAFRERLFEEGAFTFVAKLGANAFQIMNWWAATTALVIVSGQSPGSAHQFGGIDTSSKKAQFQKAEILQGRSSDVEAGQLYLLSQSIQAKNPNAAVIFGLSDQSELLSSHASAYQGSTSGDNNRFVLAFWELPFKKSAWEWFQASVDRTNHWGGCHQVIRYDGGNGPLARSSAARIQGRPALGLPGVSVSQMAGLRVALYSGKLFDMNCAALIPKQVSNLSAIWCFCESDEYTRSIRELDQSTKVTNANLVKVPFDLERWKQVAQERYPNGLPEPASTDLTQWFFHGHPAHAEPATVLHVAAARLAGYRWPAELDPTMRLAPAARSLVEACGPLAEHADDDGIVCFASLRGEGTAADRLRALLSAAYRDAGGWSAARERELIAASAAQLGKTKPVGSLEEWLADRFFEEHCTLFHRRPFLWHVWDGRKDGFHALVNYHRLAGPDGAGARTLSALAHSYLGEWIRRQRDDARKEVEGADARLAAALSLEAALERILEGEPPCDLFVRWKPLSEQAIGWNPDLDDGVRQNIRPFLKAGDVKAKDAGVLRAVPDKAWSKGTKPDRGSEPEAGRPREEFPWLFGCDPNANPEHRVDFVASSAATFDGLRWNALHYTRAAKEAARRRKKGERA